MAGQSHLPLESLARTSTRPYLMEALFLVWIRADFTGFMMVWLVAFVAITQSFRIADVQIPIAVRLSTLSVLMSFSS